MRGRSTSRLATLSPDACSAADFLEEIEDRFCKSEGHGTRAWWLQQTELLTEQGTGLVLKIFRLKEDATGEEVLCFAMQWFAVLCSALLCLSSLFCFAVLCLFCFVMLCVAVLCSAVLCNALLSSAVQYSALQCFCSALYCCALQCFATLRGAAYCYVLWHSFAC